jgi:hypothetical protein
MGGCRPGCRHRPPFGHGVRVLGEPKTERAKRTLRLGETVIATLRAHRAVQVSERLAAGRTSRDLDFVFPTKLGEAMDTSTVNRAFQAALARAGLLRQPFHHLRHAYATLMLEDGEELIVVSRSLGHSTISTTADVYAHVTPATLQRSAERMDGILRRRTGIAYGYRVGYAAESGRPSACCRGPFHVQMAGWRGRIRTFGLLIQSQAPYRLATRQWGPDSSARANVA